MGRRNVEVSQAAHRRVAQIWIDIEAADAYAAAFAEGPQQEFSRAGKVIFSALPFGDRSAYEVKTFGTGFFGE